MKILLLITISLLMTSCVAPRSAHSVNPYVYETPTYSNVPIKTLPSPAPGYHVRPDGNQGYYINQR